MFSFILFVSLSLALQLLLLTQWATAAATGASVHKIDYIDTIPPPTNNLLTRNFWRDTRKKWPRGQIPYVISNEYNANQIYIIQLAMYEWASKTCVRFIERTTQTDYVFITPSAPDVGPAKYCYCDVGRTGGRQIMRMYGECIRTAALIHEFGHLIGFNHEHQRPDRDSYVKVHTQNINPAYSYAFTKFSTNEVLYSSDGYPYDTSSVMQYPYYAFALYPNDQRYPSMTLLDGTLGPLAREAEKLSPLDISRVQKYYNNCQ